MFFAEKDPHFNAVEDAYFYNTPEDTGIYF